MVAIMAECDAIEKGRKNQQQGFAFRGIDDVYNALHPLFAKHRVYVRTEVVDRETHERTTKSGGTAFHHFVRVRFHLTHEDGSSIVFETIGEAADTGDKGVGKTLSYALKSALFAGLLIPTAADNDPDATSHEFAAKANEFERPRAAPHGTSHAPKPPVPEKTPDPPPNRPTPEANALSRYFRDVLKLTAPAMLTPFLEAGSGLAVSTMDDLRALEDSDSCARVIRSTLEALVAAGRTPEQMREWAEATVREARERLEIPY